MTCKYCNEKLQPYKELLKRGYCFKRSCCIARKRRIKRWLVKVKIAKRANVEEDVIDMGIKVKDNELQLRDKISVRIGGRTAGAKSLFKNDITIKNYDYSVFGDCMFFDTDIDGLEKLCEAYGYEKIDVKSSTEEYTYLPLELREIKWKY